eukprot:2372554-Karenia_brevis.AAC.1
MYGMRQAAAAWERHHADKLSSIRFRRGVSCGVVFYHKERDISLVVHGHDFTFCGVEKDSKWIRSHMESLYEIKVRAILGPDHYDDKEVTQSTGELFWSTLVLMIGAKLKESMEISMKRWRTGKCSI